MKIKQLGRTGVKASEICLRTMTFGNQADETTSFAIIDVADQAGVNFFDTADVYLLGGDISSVGRTEEIVGRWLRSEVRATASCWRASAVARWGRGRVGQFVAKYSRHRPRDHGLVVGCHPQLRVVRHTASCRRLCRVASGRARVGHERAWASPPESGCAWALEYPLGEGAVRNECECGSAQPGTEGVLRAAAC